MWDALNVDVSALARDDLNSSFKKKEKTVSNIIKLKYSLDFISQLSSK